jgi:hypothetical protein
LPNDAAQGVLWNQNGLNFYGWGQEGKVPVYAAADGLLTRQEDWFDTVAILHTDPLNPSRQVWSIYSDMGGSNGVTSFVAADFPPGATNVPVKAGHLDARPVCRHPRRRTGFPGGGHPGNGARPQALYRY